MTETPPQRPEGELIKGALRRSRLSARKAADLAGISEGRWRQIVNGYQSVSGTALAVKGPPETVARMAQVVGVTPEELDSADRGDAAEELRTLLRTAADLPTELRSLEPWQQDVILRALDSRPRSRREKAMLLRTLADAVDREADLAREPQLGADPSSAGIDPPAAPAGNTP